MGIPFVADFDNLAADMANPPVTKPIRNAVANFARGVCDQISARPDIFAPTILQSPLRAACQPYWDSQNYDGPKSEKPFEGGQCPTSYTIAFLADRCPSGPTDASGLISVVGPVEFVSREVRIRPNFPVNRETIWTFTNGNGGTQTLSSLHREQDTPCFRVFRDDGLPDDCGDPPEIVEPGDNPAPDNGPLPTGTGPQINVRGGVVLVLPPTLNVNPQLNVELPIGEINLGAGTGGGPAEPPLAGEELLGAGSGEGGGETDFGDPPPGERWVGCCVNITTSPADVGIIQSSLPQAIYPATIGNVRLKFQGGSGPAAYDTPIANRQRSSCVWEPTRGLAPVGCFANFLPGYAYTVTPYSVPLEQ